MEGGGGAILVTDSVKSNASAWLECTQPMKRGETTQTHAHRQRQNKRVPMLTIAHTHVVRKKPRTKISRLGTRRRRTERKRKEGKRGSYSRATNHEKRVFSPFFFPGKHVHARLNWTSKGGRRHEHKDTGGVVLLLSWLFFSATSTN